MASAEPSRSLLGSLVDGRYRVDRVVGEGGFGTVYAAQHVGFDAPVAFKVPKLPDRLRTDQVASAVGKFLEEARILKRLVHPNIVGALDVGLLPADEHGLELPYIVLEWCSGPTLKELLDARAGAPMSLEETWKLFEPLVDAMAYAHGKGVAHRDLKPSNVVLEPLEGGAFRARVIDFGIAKLVAPDDAAGSGVTRTGSGSSPFTPSYAAPEQLAGARTGPWTDVHALALIFVEMVTGRPVLGSEGDPMDTAFDPVRPTPKVRGVDVGALDAVVARALALRPADRHHDAAELAHAMRAASAAGFDEARSTALAEPLVEPLPPALLSSSVDRVAPPSSRTVRTASGTRGGLRRGPLVLVASIAAALLGVGATAGVLARAGSWPFQKPRFRELPATEVERRVKALDLGFCMTTTTDDTLTIGCEKGIVQVLRTAFAARSREAGRAYLDGVALGLADHYQGGTARLAIDGNVAVIVVTGRDRLSTAFDAVLHGALVDERAVVEPPPVPELSAAARENLAAWTGMDLWSGVAHAGLPIVWKLPKGEPSIVVINEGTKTAELWLHTTGGRAQLETIKNPPQGALKLPGMESYAYALDGDALLVIKGDPALAQAAWLRRILGSARTSEIAEHAGPVP